MRLFHQCLAVLCLAVLTLSPLRAATASELTVAAASDLKFALPEIVTGFQAAHKGDKIEVVYGSSGKLQTQIREGAPFDIFFSADIAYAQALRKDGFAATDPMPYAVGRLVLWSATRDASKMRLEDLADPKIGKIAIANPAHAPYGRCAEEVLRHAGLWDKVKDKLVFGENIAQATQYAETGAADVAMTALSIAVSKEASAKGGYALIPASLHSRLEQAYVVTRHGADKPLARAFLDYLKTKGSQAILVKFGFSPPGQAAR
ncbi:MAG: molybdate ABC transporter substrate-binding protein [Methylocystis sp.]|uniref:molybdate ABC transporter substrate-binding protein n=1 Tax=Methylocystis sp. TaxID=1911079 RepID=UPI003D138826